MAEQEQKRNLVSGSTIRDQLEKFYEKPVTRVSFELVMSLLGVMFFALFALRPTLNTMSSLLQEIEEKEEVDLALGRKISALATAQTEYLTYSERFSILDEAIHTNISLETALIYMEYLVARENLSLAGLQIQEFPLVLTAPEDASQQLSLGDREIQAYAFQISFTGSYDDVMQFFAAIESVKPLFAVQEFTFTVEENREEERTLRTTATILMYGYQSEVRRSRS
ncbi:hypothetical protein LRY65_03385 [Candidatus Woesebacteria bacterium]|nr:hypothetical protein [Candidatus Woesebacteria bacterium]MCD8506937.1 hypothetical protein [Candidatus Woesebacteria bacterium]MCD8527227.1 hypothetical protein [Candidatus Woesebacteria bacterium]MCD8546593.1 hypothetical protein [Candidatus Woesebacteria bacterium]